MRLYLWTIPAGLLAAGCAWTQTAVISPAEYDFGSVKQGERLSHAFQIRNPGQAPLRIERIDLSVAGITTRFRSPVPPGGAATVTLEWDTARMAGESQATALVHTNDPQHSEVPLVVRAVVQPPIEFAPFPAVFFTAYRDEALEKSVRIINHDEAPLEIRLSDVPAHYDVRLETLRPGREYELRVKNRAGVPLGRYSEPIYLETNRPVRPRLEVRANLFVKADFYAFPEEIDFGSVRLGELDAQPGLVELLTQSTVVTNRSGAVRIESIQTDLDFITISRTPESGAEQKFLLQVAPVRDKMRPGRIDGSIRVRVSGAEGAEVVIPVRGEIR